MYNFTDLIARSYLEYTEECEDNIAVFFFQQYHQVRYENKFIFTKNLFYKKLIEHLEHLIDCTYHNTHFKDENYSGFEDAESVAFENYQIERLENHQKLLKLQFLYS